MIDPETGSLTFLDATPEGFAAATAEHGECLNQLLLTRLAALNRERAAEESTGLIRYLRPDFQARGVGILPTAPSQSNLPLPDPESVPAAKQKPAKLPWLADLPSQATAIRHALCTFPHGATLPQLAALFGKAPKPGITTILETLTALGHACLDGDRYLTV